MRVRSVELVNVKSRGLGINYNGVLNIKTKVLVSASIDAGLGQF